MQERLRLDMLEFDSYALERLITSKRLSVEAKAYLVTAFTFGTWTLADQARLLAAYGSAETLMRAMLRRCRAKGMLSSDRHHALRQAVEEAVG